jgi:hypothetical protein
MNFKDLKEETIGLANQRTLCFSQSVHGKRITRVIHSLKYINQLRIG